MCNRVLSESLIYHIFPWNSQWITVQIDCWIFNSYHRFEMVDKLGIIIYRTVPRVTV